MPRLSVIIPTYNRVRLLGKAIESVKRAGDDAEIIVVDDASTDQTKNYCQNLEGIKYIRLEQNQGTAGARNVGLQASTAPFISFLDDDDWRLPATFLSQLSLLEEDKTCGLVYGKILLANQCGELIGETNGNYPNPQGDVLLQLLGKNFIPLSTVILRRECIDKVGLFDSSPKMLGIEDWDLWLRVSEFYSVKSVSEPVAVYRQPENTSGQWSSDITRMFSLAASAYKEKWFNLPGVRSKLGAELSARKKRILAHISDIILYQALNNSKNIMQKKARFRLALKCWPQNLVHLKFYKALVKAILNRQ